MQNYVKYINSRALESYLGILAHEHEVENFPNVLVNKFESMCEITFFFFFNLWLTLLPFDFGIVRNRYIQFSIC